MRRTPLRRKTPLAASSEPLPGGKGLRRSRIRQKPSEPLSAAERAAAAVFKASIKGLGCVVCGRTEAEAYRETGMGHQAHHAIRQQVLRKLGLDVWDPRLAVCTCEEPCHRRHTTRKERIERRVLPAGALEFVAEHGLELELEREYPR